ncbi:EAL domain-containing protein [Mesorhizobium sp. BAC0120]|uniref:putative bifunctional diguanylate cyclase/phosphodiesterase n=1 Tax=Mesorhizobium sp. BAC0120 TaxID=3090670 RepID=UPI00298C57FA|nr:EAL domain-containing protein [Mesorhizobium sp. BAC0120]MDW6024991.1 EAL domain-containing protein [Mesorhizobium sp. BAC0120]
MKINRPEDISEDVYVGFVRSLFHDAFVLVVGAICYFLLALLVYERTGEPIYAWLAVIVLAAGFYRYYRIEQYRKADCIHDYASALKAERSYLIGGTIQGFFMGLFCFVAIYWVPDPYGEVASVSAAVASTITVVGRNYGSKTMVAILSVVLILPIALGELLKGDIAHIVFGLYIVPVMFIITKMAARVRTVLFTAITEEKKSTDLAQRFDRALNTMSHGLIMLDSDGRVVVANAEANATLGVKQSDALLGRSLGALVMRTIASGMVRAKDGHYLEAQLTRALHEGRGRKIQVRLADGRYVEFSVSEGAGGLGVITFEDVSTRIEAEEKIRSMARYDNLTGLINRAYFHELAGEMMATGDQERNCALVAFDLDDFKSVNDTLGHPIGDGLIYAVAEKLSGFGNDRTKVSRFGGDEFMIFIDDVESEAELSSILENIFKALQGEVDVAGHSLRVQASAGAVLSCVKDSDIDAMIVKADLALYKAKELGKNGWRLFEATMDAAFRNRQLLKAELRSAVEAKGLRVVYQPIVSIETMRIASCEALCRWDHPDLGPISPAVFIPLAEEMGIISEISNFMLAAATRECTRWPGDTSVSVNLSAKDFRDRGIVDKVRAALAESGLAAHRLEVEVTETVLLDDKSQARELIEELKALGVRIALDDFGTGYSSLSYLHKLPLDKIKIDRSFLIDVTQNQRSLELLTGIVNLSRPLGLSVTIEGVETFEQLRLLALKVQPDLVQGFLFGSALTASGIETMSTTVWPFASELKSARRAVQR